VRQILRRSLASYGKRSSARWGRDGAIPRRLIKENAKADVRETIREEFDELPEVYDRRLWEDKVERTYQFMFERYPGEIAAPPT
jgi:hypothetical protein